MGIFDTMLSSLVNMGFFQTLFPFLLALAIFYGILMFAAKDRLGKGPIALISLILSFFVMLYAQSIPGLAQMIQMLSGTTLAVAVGILFIIVVIGLMGVQFKDIWGDKKWLMVLIIIVVVFGIMTVMGGFPGLSITLPFFVSNSDLVSIVLFLVIIAIAWHFMTKEGGEKKEEKPSK